jgi:hypothetical protein
MFPKEQNCPQVGTTANVESIEQLGYKIQKPMDNIYYFSLSLSPSLSPSPLPLSLFLPHHLMLRYIPESPNYQ